MNEHAHGHHHHLEHSEDKRSLIAAFIITILMMAAEFIGGVFSGSLALISDAGHMLTDAGSLFLALLASVFSRQPSTSEKTFGFYRLEILAALFNGSVLMILSGYIFYQAVLRFFKPEPVQGQIMLIIAAIGLAANIISAIILQKSSERSLNVKGAFLHVVSDALSSVGVIIGGILIIKWNLYIIDPILGCVIGLLILRGGINLVMESVDILLEATPADIDINSVVKTILGKVKEAKDVHDVHIWTITSGLRAFSAHVLMDDTKISSCGNISRAIKEVLEHDFDIKHTTLEFECESCEEGIVCRMRH